MEIVITDENPSTVTLTAMSSEEQVVPTSGLAITGNGSTRQLNITPASETPGNATITLTAEDEAGRTSSLAFDLTVTEPFPTPTELTTQNATPIGTAVAISDKYAVVGAFESVYVFERLADDWVEMQKLTPTVPPLNPTDFGWAVDIDGERIIVGADEDNDGGDRAGAAYIFELIGGTWTQSKKLVDPLPADFDSMGRSVAINGDYAFVGAQGDVQGGIDSGSMFVFQYYDLGGWTLWGKLNPADAQADDVFGESVDSDSDALIVGNYGDPKRGSEAGSANVFRLVNFVWTEEVELAPLELEAGDQFGLDVAIDEDYVLVAAANDDDGGQDAGAVYVFHDDGNSLTQVDKLVPDDASDFASFGSSVALDMPYAVIGAQGDDGILNNAGSVYVFRFDGADWQQVAKLTSPSPAANAEFGWDVGISGENLIAAQVGAPPLAAMFAR